jgi:hypothetical protein
VANYVIVRQDSHLPIEADLGNGPEPMRFATREVAEAWIEACHMTRVEITEQEEPQ